MLISWRPTSARAASPRRASTSRFYIAHHHPCQFKAAHRAVTTAAAVDTLDACLTTQVSLDRFSSFARTALAWGGPVSVAVYIPAARSSPLAPLYEEYLQSCVERLRAACGRAGGRQQVITVTLLHADHYNAVEGADVLQSLQLGNQSAVKLPPQASASASPLPPPGTATATAATAARSYEQLYPINALRNAALAAATAPLVLPVDADFIPSLGIQMNGHAAPSASQSHRLHVVLLLRLLDHHPKRLVPCFLCMAAIAYRSPGVSGGCVVRRLPPGRGGHGEARRCRRCCRLAAADDYKAAGPV